MKEKKFEMKRRDGSIAVFHFDKPKGSVWYLRVPQKGEGAAVPFPDVDFGNCKTLKDCLDAMSKARGEAWVGQVYMDFMKCDKP